MSIKVLPRRQPTMAVLAERAPKRAVRRNLRDKEDLTYEEAKARSIGGSSMGMWAMTEDMYDGYFRLWKRKAYEKTYRLMFSTRDGAQARNYLQRSA